MSAQWREPQQNWLVLRDFSAGIDQSAAADNTAVSAVYQAVNCTAEQDMLRAVPAPQAVPGMELAGLRRLMLHHAQDAQGKTASTLLAATDDDVLRWTGTDWVSIRGDMPVRSGAFSYLNFRSGDTDIVILGNGVDDLYRWDGSGTLQRLFYSDEQTRAPRGGCLALHYERLWVGGVHDAAQSVFYSDDMAPDNWTSGSDAAGEIQLQTWDGDRVTALANLLDDIVVFKRRAAFRIVGAYPGEYQKVQVYATQGAIAPGSICAWHDRAYFLSDDGLMLYDGLRARPLHAGRIRDIERRIHAAAVDGACAAIWKNRLYLAVPLDGAAHNNAVIEYDLIRESFWLKEGMTVHGFLIWQDALYFTDGQNVLRYEGDGATLALNWQMPLRDLGRPQSVKRMVGCYLSVRGQGTLRLRERFDASQRVADISLPAQETVVRVPLYGRGRRIGLELEKTDGGALRLGALQLCYEQVSD
ncbi:MAG: hypothetical protein PHO66_00195 [Eubacteriales bacterium]|nr:hypothetical protein [Eubacteriales bacterium]